MHLRGEQQLLLLALKRFENALLLHVVGAHRVAVDAQVVLPLFDLHEDLQSTVQHSMLVHGKVNTCRQCNSDMVAADHQYQIQNCPNSFIHETSQGGLQD